MNNKSSRVLQSFIISSFEVTNFKQREMATQLAETLQVSLDYLVGATDTLLETSLVNRILDIQKLKDNDKEHVFALLDAFLKQTKLKAIM